MALDDDVVGVDEDVVEIDGDGLYVIYIPTPIAIIITRPIITHAKRPKACLLPIFITSAKNNFGDI
ncbi:hypothetical protein GCM10007981_05880 [Thermocladium modestius]|uniref:Uncharacterized protein n=1 Tax=Thermocladium modestius TaxID=62609 RepID=A0A830GUP8_9CREN|nr:hypothetical protein GCM10007981_05880 [Thermocladium modestius]